MNLFRLAWASLISRKANALLTVLAIAISVMLLLGVERVSEQTRAGFANTISGTDLIVGARSGPVNLLLFSVFHIGNPAANVNWASYEHWREHDQVAWTIPIALGDSYRGHPVVATDENFFQHFQYGRQQAIHFGQGSAFSQTDHAVIGARVARAHQLGIGDDLIISHGTGSVSFHQHDDDPMHISGILAPTGTPIDNAVLIPLPALAAMHGEGHHHEEEPAPLDFTEQKPSFNGQSIDEEEHDHDDSSHSHEHAHDHAHQSESLASLSGAPVDSLSAFFVGLHSKPRAIFMQRTINTWSQEPLTALMPGATLQELWRTLNMFERTLAIVSAFVLLTGLIGMLATLLASLQERRREMAVLRSLGAGPKTVFALLVSEALVLTLIGIGLGVAMLYAAMFMLAPWLETSFGIVINIGAPSWVEWQRMAIVFFAGFVISCLPAWRAYRNSLADGLTIKV